MAQSKKERFEQILRELRESNDEIDGAALLTPGEGMLLAHNLSSNHGPEQITAISTALLGLGKKATAALQNGGFEELHVQGAAQATLVFDAGKSLLALTMKPGANLGMINLDARSAVEAIHQAFARTG